MSTGENPLREYFRTNNGRKIEKWDHYFDVYHRHFERFRGKPAKVLEIGVYHGGSLQMWKHYFGSQAKIVGVDVNPRCSALAEPGIEIVIGDQANRAFLRSLVQSHGPFDIVIDDGGHTMVQQQVSLEELYTAVNPGGVYLVEDIHTSYWSEYGGGFRNPYSFIELAKRLVDLIHAHHSRDPQSFAPTGFTATTGGMHFYDSMLVLDRVNREVPRKVDSGKPSFAD